MLPWLQTHGDGVSPLVLPRLRSHSSRPMAMCLPPLASAGCAPTESPGCAGHWEPPRVVLRARRPVWARHLPAGCAHHHGSGDMHHMQCVHGPGHRGMGIPVCPLCANSPVCVPQVKGHLEQEPFGTKGIWEDVQAPPDMPPSPPGHAPPQGMARLEEALQALPCPVPRRPPTMCLGGAVSCGECGVDTSHARHQSDGPARGASGVHQGTS